FHAQSETVRLLTRLSGHRPYPACRALQGPYLAPGKERIMEDFRTFIARREEAARAFCRGDVSRVVDLSARTDPATFFGPDGKVVEGAEAVRKDYQSASGAFGPGGDCGFEVMQMTSDGDLGFWTGL